MSKTLKTKKKLSRAGEKVSKSAAKRARGSKVTVKGKSRQKKAAKPRRRKTPDYDGLPGSAAAPTGPDESWTRIAAARPPAFDQSVPGYLLDPNYYFLDWNPAFDELVAGPLNLQRGRSHAEDFVKRMENVADVYERSKRVFDPRHVPLIDIEPLVLKTKKYGIVKFEKIAVQIPDSQARLFAWSVFLNITRADKFKQLWTDLKSRLDRELNWSRYAVSYDTLLLNFDDNHDLIDLVVKEISDCERCLDLGAGTGNVTLKLLQTRDDREVWAVESNHAMLNRLVEKVERAQLQTGEAYFDRLTATKEDVLRLDGNRALMPTNYFDAAILVNVLYAVSDPGLCLRETYELLREGGKLVLSTPHSETDVDKLFKRIREVLEEKGLFSKLRSNFLDAQKRHEVMMDQIHRDSKDDIRDYIENAGFRITAWHDSEYAGAVVVVVAVKD